MGKARRLPSLELAMDLTTPIGAGDGGMSCVYGNSLSWSSPTTPLPTEADPRVVFERLFGDGCKPERRQAELRKTGSILDWMTPDPAQLPQDLAPLTRTRMAPHPPPPRAPPPPLHNPH